MALRTIVVQLLLLVILSDCETCMPQLESTAASANGSAVVTKPVTSHGVVLNDTYTTEVHNVTKTTTSRSLISNPCKGSDIKINQEEISGVGLPTWQVRIINECTNPSCTISNVIVQCGLFHSGLILVNPMIFRRLDAKQGTCIVNNGRTIGRMETITFKYREIWMEPLRYRSARISCVGG
ncbi:uncharacterized protein At1g05835 [Physcomitrium patens]|uniref:Uncharacterized protein n=1 Tax=Physcomitrium patens TaxID=3218 RepID=A9TCK9_PHYPA|nr:TPD1 protein homolog 1-like [Physcomitrium patens]XP_024369318.1 TPD1 protein homolog 1-like [Physcomitrium patens]PNR57692.1 hypothetical protein PHYPA_004686 [Physcomitrium patens]|eukprot:XP_024369317.1 TPD1 protein homolog 1-like [Physcomitrella patens]